MQINSKEYLNNLYKGDWEKGYQDAYKRLDKEIELLEKFDKHLDIGCADGYFTKRYLEKYPETKGWGVDISDVIVEEIKQDNFISADCYHLPFKDKEFDLVHSAELIEHLENPRQAINEMKRVLKEKGILVLTTPYKEYPLYEEHLWSWGIDEVKELVNLELIGSDAKFFNGIMRLVFQK